MSASAGVIATDHSARTRANTVYHTYIHTHIHTYIHTHIDRKKGTDKREKSSLIDDSCVPSTYNNRWRRVKKLTCTHHILSTCLSIFIYNLYDDDDDEHLWLKRKWLVSGITLRENFVSDIPDCIYPYKWSFISFATNRLMAIFFFIGVHHTFLFYLYKIPSGTTTSFFFLLYLFDVNQSYVQDDWEFFPFLFFLFQIISMIS